MARTSRYNTPPKEMALELLRNNSEPMTAYHILSSLQSHGVKSPPIVYRALEALLKTGEIHRIDALNAYVACNCNHKHAHEITVLTVCKQCGDVKEHHHKEMMEHLLGLQKFGIAIASGGVVQLPICCENCSNPSAIA